MSGADESRWAAWTAWVTITCCSAAVALIVVANLLIQSEPGTDGTPIVIDRCHEPPGPDTTVASLTDCRYRTQQPFFGQDSDQERWWLQLTGDGIATEESWVPVTRTQYDRREVTP